MNTGSSRGPAGNDRAIRHNPRAGESAQGGCAEANMQGWLTLNEVASRADMSTRFIRKHLSEIPHYRSSARGKMRIDWPDFQSWMRKLRVEIRQDDPVVDTLQDLAQYAATK